MGRDNPDKSYARELLGLLREELAHLRSTPLWEGGAELPLDEKLRHELRTIEHELEAWSGANRRGGRYESDPEPW